ncbi:DUF5955 family protein [Streptomyces aureocirculatus]|uniref:DUF5955 family protein n=1 Tax=Streptomyces aureocirculatus TaxID=67275 RepID=UPI0012FEF838|nr:DUF5955 family protein [Streptomyces aureocirculatus]
MPELPSDGQRGNQGVQISGGARVSGPVAAGRQARATQHNQAPVAAETVSAEAERVVSLLGQMRDQLQDTQLDGYSRQTADQAITDAVDEASDLEPEPGRLWGAVHALAGALAGVTGLATLLAELRQAVGDWFPALGGR